MENCYNPQKIESKWQKKWEKGKIFSVEEGHTSKKYYLLEMFPYPSGKIHMGHVRVYSIGDAIARYKKMCKYNVLHPIGWDAFGMPAENAAINSGVHPAKWTYKNINYMRSQLKRLGFSYDWDREITTSRPEYYRWEQWLFVKMLENGMAYRKKSFVNWCSNCQTVLANEQVSDGICWRCGEEVVQKKLWQWFLKITEYADDLLVYCDKLPGWPEKVTTMQKNWIGKSLGVEINFPIENSNNSISVFTTRPDTIFGVTFISLAPEHSMVFKLAQKHDRHNKISNFIKSFKKYDKNSNFFDNKSSKEGIFTGTYCINPVNGDRLPIYVASFAIIEHGTGAVMSVPAHDQRDFEFAKKYKLPIKVVIDSKLSLPINEAFTGTGILIDSGSFSGAKNDEVFEDIIEYLEDNGFGKRTVNFKLRDWGISRQRYWGTPIPVVYCKSCGVVPVKYQDLPVILPEELELLDGGKSALAATDSFVVTDCPNCGRSDARRETDTMDTFVESSWYFERFCSPTYDKAIFDQNAVDYWMPVDQYVGGIEHAILHLLYSRYLTRVLNKFGLVNYKEPFSKVLTQGMVCKETFKCPKDGFIFPEEANKNNSCVVCSKCGKFVDVGRVEKMSKSKKNVVDPDILLDRYGSDVVRLFCLFAAPPEKNLEWSEQNIEGSSRFLKRVWRITFDWFGLIEGVDRNLDFKFSGLSDSFSQLLFKTHETIKKVTIDIEDRSNFNTAISSIMELINVMYSMECSEIKESEKKVMRFSLESVILLLSPITPHICEELWQALGYPNMLARQDWPQYSEEIINKNEIVLVVQVNGKVRKRISVFRNMSEEDLKNKIFSDDRILKFIDEKEVKKIFYIKNKLVNIVV